MDERGRDGPIDRPDTALRWPWRGVWAKGCEWLAGSRRLRGWRRATLGRLPFVTLASDVSNILYANWLVPPERVAHLVPRGVGIAPVGDKVLLTILTYRHGHFGPFALGPLRRLLPSPGQSNWRLYVDDLDGHALAGPTVLFVHNIFDHPLHVIGARLFSDALPSHLAAEFVHRHSGGRWESRIDGGDGSAASIAIVATDATGRDLPASFAGYAVNWRTAVERITQQDAALCAIPDCAGLALAEIILPIDPATAQPLRVESYRPGRWLESLGALEAPFCFVVPSVDFRVLGERIVHAGKEPAIP